MVHSMIHSLAPLFVAAPGVLGAAALANADPTTLWYVTRAAAISAYILLTLTAGLGLLRNTVRAARVRSAGLIWLLDEAHQYTAALATVFVALHLVSLLFDPVVPFTFTNLLVPIDEPYRQTAVNLGVFSLYTLGAVLLSSWMRRSLPYGLWRGLHFASFLAFVLVTLHGILAGADSTQPWMQAVYGVAAGAVMLLVGVRLLVVAFAEPAGQPSA
jgi:sulfoxide reductase heme-binding subunit YedZ